MRKFRLGAETCRRFERHGAKFDAQLDHATDRQRNTADRIGDSPDRIGESPKSEYAGIHAAERDSEYDGAGFDFADDTNAR